MRYNVKCTDGQFFVIKDGTSFVSGPLSEDDAWHRAWNLNALAETLGVQTPQGLCA